jgi:hypothetical protein
MTEIMASPTPITTPVKTISLPREANITPRVTTAIETRTTSRRSAVRVCVAGDKSSKEIGLQGSVPVCERSRSSSG